MTPVAQKKSRKQNPSKTIAKKTKYDEIYGTDSDESVLSDEIDSDDSDEADDEDGETSPECQVVEFWKSVQPPVAESSIKEKWFAAIYIRTIRNSLCT